MIQDSKEHLDVDVEHPYELSNPEIYEKIFRPRLQELIDNRDLKCDGCGKPLRDRGWICVNHRPKSALSIKENLRLEDKETGEVYGEGEFDLKDKWAVFLFCFDTRESCITKWKDRRPK